MSVRAHSVPVKDAQDVPGSQPGMGVQDGELPGLAQEDTPDPKAPAPRTFRDTQPAALPAWVLLHLGN